MTHYTYPITIEKEDKRYYAYSDLPGVNDLGSSSEQSKNMLAIPVHRGKDWPKDYFFAF